LMTRLAWPGSDTIVFDWVGFEVPSDTHTPYNKIGNVHFEARDAVRPRARRLGRQVGALRSEQLRSKQRAHLRFSGGHGGGAIPDPIPNSEVKPSCADGTAGATLWESRSLPDLCPEHASARGFFIGSPEGIWAAPRCRGSS